MAVTVKEISFKLLFFFNTLAWSSVQHPPNPDAAYLAPKGGIQFLLH